ncbi:MAG: hypothetical protein U5N53_12550 [Mycobacterium sp.]|nr:hypothetical protein [Mycobacterium sp.]
MCKGVFTTDSNDDGPSPGGESEIPAYSAAPLTIDDLATRIGNVEGRQIAAHKETTFGAVALSVLIVGVIAAALWSWTEFGPQPSPTTADDTLESLLRPGPHCYPSAAEMAPARQRALAATDRMRWEEAFPRRWTAKNTDHRTTTPR